MYHYIYYPKNVIGNLRIATKINNKPTLKKILWFIGQTSMWYIKWSRNVPLYLMNNRIYTRELFQIERMYIKDLKSYQLINFNKSFVSYIPKILHSTSLGYRKYIRIRGVGYKYTLLPNNCLNITLGFSHLIDLSLKKNLKFKTSRKKKVLQIRGDSLTEIKNLMSYLRRIKAPDPYKGKGIRYKKDKAVIKPGKKPKL